MLHTLIDRLRLIPEHAQRHAEAVADSRNPPKARTLIVAGSIRQAEHWAKEQGWSKADFIRHGVYAPTLERFLGHSPDTADVVFTGTWLQHDDAMEIHRHANMMGYTIFE